MHDMQGSVIMQAYRNVASVVAATVLCLALAGCSQGLAGEGVGQKKRRMLAQGVKRNLGAVTWAKAFYTSERVLRQHFPAVKVDHKARVIESDMPIRDEEQGPSRQVALLRLSRAGANVIAQLYIGRYRRGPRVSVHVSGPCPSCSGRRDSVGGNRAKPGRRARTWRNRSDCFHGRDLDVEELPRSWGAQPELARDILEEINHELDVNAAHGAAEGPAAALAE